MFVVERILNKTYKHIKLGTGGSINIKEIRNILTVEIFNTIEKEKINDGTINHV